MPIVSQYNNNITEIKEKKKKKKRGRSDKGMEIQ
jgi:hypothetical protein